MSQTSCFDSFIKLKLFSKNFKTSFFFKNKLESVTYFIKMLKNLIELCIKL